MAVSFGNLSSTELDKKKKKSCDNCKAYQIINIQKQNIRKERCLQNQSDFMFCSDKIYSEK